MDRHVICWHQMVSRDSYGSEILISCQPLEEKVKSIGSARTGLAYWCKWKLEYQIERSELERFLQGDFEFCSQVHRACLPHWLRKRQPVQGGCRCGGCPHGQLRLCRVPCGPPCGLHFRAQGDFTSWDATVALSVSTGACLG